jgi:hypothetical protein
LNSGLVFSGLPLFGIRATYFRVKLGPPCEHLSGVAPVRCVLCASRQKNTRLRESAARRERARGSCCCVEHELSFSLFVAKGTRRSVRWDSQPAAQREVESERNHTRVADGNVLIATLLIILSKAAKFCDHAC